MPAMKQEDREDRHADPHGAGGTQPEPCKFDALKGMLLADIGIHFTMRAFCFKDTATSSCSAVFVYAKDWFIEKVNYCRNFVR